MIQETKEEKNEQTNKKTLFITKRRIKLAKKKKGRRGKGNRVRQKTKKKQKNKKTRNSH
jgi:formate hydrogenlyase subunit 6/NADH:ubiquinone oxidoreductase subunit I